MADFCAETRSGMPERGDALNSAEVRGLVVLIRENAPHAAFLYFKRPVSLLEKPGVRPPH